MKNRRVNAPCSEQEYEKKLKELEELQTLIGQSDKFPSPEDLLKQIIEQVLTKSQSDPLIPKAKKLPKKNCVIN